MKRFKRVLRILKEVSVELRRHKIGLIGLSILLIEIGLVIFFPFIADPVAIDSWYGNLDYFAANPRLAPPIWASYLFPWERPPTTTIEPQIVREDFYFNKFDGDDGFYAYYLKSLGDERRIVINGTTYDLSAKEFAEYFWNSARDKYSKISIVRVIYAYDFYHGKEPVDVIFEFKLKVPVMRDDDTENYRYAIGLYIHRPDGLTISLLPGTFYPKNIYKVSTYAYNRTDLRSLLVRELLSIESVTSVENGVRVVSLRPDTKVVLSLYNYRSLVWMYGLGRYREDFVYDILAPVVEAANETNNWRPGVYVNFVEITFSKAEPGLLEGRASKLNGKYIFEILLFYTFRPGEENASVDIEADKLVIGGGWGLLGTDHRGRDLWSAVVYGIRWALLLGVVVALVTNLTGALYGVTSAYFGGKVDMVMQQVYRVYISIPTLPILILLSYTIGRSIWILISLMIIFGLTSGQYTVRSMALQLREQTYVEAARALGASHARIVLRYIYPQIAPYLFASIALSVPGAILTEAGISFLGLGDPLLVTWGKILEEAANGGAFEHGAWWWIVFPGLAIVVTSLAFIMFGQAIERIIEPRLRTR